MYIGTTLTLKRLLDAGLPWWLVVLFFPPFLNLVFFAFMCMFPTKTLTTDHYAQHKKLWLDAMIPKSNAGNAVLATLFTATLAAFAAWFSTNVIRDYGWTLFLGIPFIQ